MATFGKTTNGTSSTASSADRKKVSSASPATGGTLTKLTGRFWLSAAGTGDAKGVVYADNAGAPGALLATGDAVPFTHTTEQAVDLPFSGVNQITLVAGTTYWIGWHHKDPGTPSNTISRDATAGASQTNLDTYSDGPTNPFGTPTAEAGPIDCYGTYTESGGTAIPNIPTLLLMGV